MCSGTIDFLTFVFVAVDFRWRAVLHDSSVVSLLYGNGSTQECIEEADVSAAPSLHPSLVSQPRKLAMDCKSIYSPENRLDSRK